MHEFSLTRRGFLASASAALAMPAQSDSMEIVLSNPFRVAELAWPRSLVRHAVHVLTATAAPGQYRLVNLETNSAVPFQWTGLQMEGGLLRAGTANFLTDLPSGATRRFRLEVNQAATPQFEGPVTVRTEGKRTIVGNGVVRVELPSGTDAAQPPVVRFGNGSRWLATGAWSGSLRAERCRVEEVAAGPIVSEHRLYYEFGGGRRYTVLLRCVAGAEFFELEEAAEGFAGKAANEWKLVWDGIEFEQRYNRNRPGSDSTGKEQAQSSADVTWEPVAGIQLHEETTSHPYRFSDQKLGPDGRLPMKIVPYHNWRSWWRLPAAAFWSEKEDISAGVFITDMEKWDDGLYAIWASKDALAIHFHLVNNRLEWRFPVRSGTRAIALTIYQHRKDAACVDRVHKPIAYVDDLRRWHGWIPLDKIRHWVLEFPANQAGYPRFFSSDRLTVHDANAGEALLRMLATDTERGAGLSPVGSRWIQSSLVPAFDSNASRMNPADFRYCCSVYAFVAYLYADEALMPMRRMLSGHPNFLADVKAAVGCAAFLLPQHPQAAYWADHFEKFLELNLRYHVRPDVRSWMAQGGRWTENLGTYVWAALIPMVRVNWLLHHHYDGRNRIAQPSVSLLGQWLINTVTTPQNDPQARGRRVRPPQGAHALRIPFAYQVRVFGQELAYYDPLTSEHILWLTSPDDDGFEGEESHGRSPWRPMLKGWETNRGTNPHLRSSKFTGWGYVLRSEVDTPKEVSVFLQQIDAGPNYRWGRAARGGNGVIYYYAGGRTYSHNGTEDVGDGYFGDVERSTNFGVKKPGGYRCVGPYRAVGQNELTEPLLDFGFSQYARVNANQEAAPEYISRSVVLSGADYIVVHDHVRDEDVEGRLSWFVRREDEFPYIHQLKPGVQFVEAALQRVDAYYSHDPAVLPTKGRWYDGRGSFLTVVTHRENITSRATEFGCEVHCPDRTDLILHSPYTEADFAFEGTSGFLSHRKDGDRAALFEGTRLELAGIGVKVLEGTARLSIALGHGGASGLMTTLAGARVVFSGLASHPLYVDGVKQPRDCRVSAGLHRWQCGSEPVIPAPANISGTSYGRTGFTAHWAAVAGATSYNLEISEDNGATWKPLLTAIHGTACSVPWPDDQEKFHIRVVTQGPGESGSPSADYPVYHATQVPHHAEGLRVRRRGNRITASWGEVLGVQEYRLYGRLRGESAFKLVYQGPRREWSADVGDSAIREFQVASANGIGESKRSEICDTDARRFRCWDPRPGEGFRRDTESAENGYYEFDDWVEERAPILVYPT